MPGQIGIAVAGILQHADIRHNQRIDAQVRAHIHSMLPLGPVVGLGIGIDGDKHFLTVIAHISHRLFKADIVKIQAGKTTGIGFVVEADINRIGAIVDSRFDGRKISRRTHQFHHNANCFQS